MLELDAPSRRRDENRPAQAPPITLTSIATAAPRHVLRQADVVRCVQALFAGHRLDIDRLLPAFGNAGIETRRSCVPIDWYFTPSDWKTRNGLFIDNAVDLLAEAAQRCLAQAGLPAGAVDAIVTVSTTGIATPSLDARLMERLPFRRDAMRLPVFGLGCAGGVLGLSRAAALAKASPGSKVLCLVVELCALTFRANDRSKSNVIAAALFGDGAAAVLLEAPQSGTGSAAGLRLGAGGEYTWPDSLDVMGWEMENDGLGVLFSRDIPALIRERLGTAAETFLARQGLSRADIDGYVCHPGGAKVITALEEVFGLPEGGLSDARSVLRDYGNMSAVTVLFVLERMREAGMKGRYLMTALGPGFTAGFQILEAPGPAAAQR
ncbi:MAG: 3-oxoacyl-[acyl-carrier-protein] synthase III C-terminal domain-containing protein [Kiloniellaceae bacterium]